MVDTRVMLVKPCSRRFSARVALWASARAAICASLGGVGWVRVRRGADEGETPHHGEDEQDATHGVCLP